MAMLQRNCRFCGTEFETNHSQKIYCSEACAREKSKQRFPRSAWPDLPSWTVGTMAELRVSTDLLSKGFHVFRNVSPSGPCDLIAFKDEKILRIEVCTGYRNPRSDKLMWPKKATSYIFDVLAICIGQEVHYKPEI